MREVEVEDPPSPECSDVEEADAPAITVCFFFYISLEPRVE